MKVVTTRIRSNNTCVWSRLWMTTMLLASICLTSTTTRAMILSTDKRRSNSRYFTQKGMLPPLESVHHHQQQQQVISNSTTIPYSDPDLPSSHHHCRSIPVVYTNDPNTVCEWLTNHLPFDGCTIGFDVESRPAFAPRKGPQASSFRLAATVQLATPDACLVVHLVRRSGRHSHSCAPILKAVLCDEEFIKAGCALDDDMMDLYQLWKGGLEATSRFDLGFLGLTSDTTTRPRCGLQTLSRQVLGVHLPKNKDVALSDWSTVPLSPSQIIYSARDAWAGAAIAAQLAEHDPDTFGHEALLETLQQSKQPPISKLVQRLQRRNKAKRDLGRILKSYKSSWLPEGVHADKVRDLKQVIKLPVNPPHLVLDQAHLETLDKLI